jgi:uncharacterized protein YecE (DUF72 family)
MCAGGGIVERGGAADTGAMGQVRIGTSGWLYRGWNQRFYPADLPRRAVLGYIAEQFDSVEVNGSFYGLLRPETYRRWADETPRAFRFAVKGSRFITHNKKLRDVATPLANFFASGLLALGPKLGPIVWQLPARAGFDPERLAEFFALLPRDATAAARLARRHDHRVAGRSWTRAIGRRRIRHAIEVRNPEFLVPEFIALARRARIAVVSSDAPDWPRLDEVTADFVYIRLHGAERTYASRYRDTELDAWADRIRAWQRGGEPVDARRVGDRAAPRRSGRDVYVYFDNDFEANAPHDALRLAERLQTESAWRAPTEPFSIRPRIRGVQPMRRSR